MLLLVDMNLSPDWVEFLQQAGHQAIHWSQVGQLDAPDEELLRHAKSIGAAVLTHDLDFGAILAKSGTDGPSVIQFREQQTSPQVIGPMLLKAINQCGDQISAGALVTVDFKRAKARILPIR